MTRMSIPQLQPPTLITTEQMLSMQKEDGVDRELIRGKIKEREMTGRGFRHTRTASNLTWLLKSWLALQPEPRGEVLVGEAILRLRHDPDTTVEVDLAYISAATLQASGDDTFLINDIPVLVVEILSPSDQMEDILEKVDEYLAAGVPLVWVAEPKFRTVTVYRPGAEPVMFSASQELTAEPILPGFKARVAHVFG